MPRFLYTLRNTKYEIGFSKGLYFINCISIQFFMTVKHFILSFCAKTIQEIYDNMELFMNMSRCNKNCSKSDIDNIIRYYKEEMFVL